MAMTPTCEPTERSMLRDTMMSTMPVAMMAVPLAWTASVSMFAGLMSLPPDRMWKPTRITIRATSMPNRRTSISVAAKAIRAARGRCAGRVLRGV